MLSPVAVEIAAPLPNLYGVALQYEVSRGLEDWLFSIRCKINNSRGCFAKYSRTDNFPNHDTSEFSRAASNSANCTASLMKNIGLSKRRKSCVFSFC